MPDAVPLDLSVSRRVHIVGVAGAGMSAIALFLARMGHRVSGSDIKDAPVLTRLEAAGVRVRRTNHPDNVPRDADAVVYSTAVPASNTELVVARELGLAVMHRSGALTAIAATRRTIAVAGSHGKTTTSSMLSLILRAAGWEPSFVIGGDVNEVGSNAAYGTGAWLVVEADESDGTFLHLQPEAAIITSVEPDHLDYYGDFDALVSAFERFVDACPGPVVVSADDVVTARIASVNERVRTYGEHRDSHYRITDCRVAATGCTFTLVADDRALGELAVPIGVKAAVNAAGATAMALEIGVDFASAARALRGFAGVARRFQFRGTRDGVTFVDDYAHLPGEVEAAIATARQGGWNRIVVVFQPHRYSRTSMLGAQFADAFTGADVVVVTDVYGAGEHPIPGVTGRVVAGAVMERHPELAVHYASHTGDLASVPREFAKPGDLVLTLGAGDLTAMPDVWMSQP